MVTLLSTITRLNVELLRTPVVIRKIGTLADALMNVPAVRSRMSG